MWETHPNTSLMGGTSKSKFNDDNELRQAFNNLLLQFVFEKIDKNMTTPRACADVLGRIFE